MWLYSHVRSLGDWSSGCSYAGDPNRFGADHEGRTILEATIHGGPEGKIVGTTVDPIGQGFQDVHERLHDANLERGRTRLI